MRRFAVPITIALAVALVANLGAAMLDARSGDQRRNAAEHDLRARLTRLHVGATDVRCRSGRACTVVLTDGRVAEVDPLEPDLTVAIARTD